MTDKEKIRNEVEKLKSQLIRGACSSQMAMETCCKEEAYNEVLAILDTMQEEPVSEDLDSFAINYAQDKPYPVVVCQAVKAGAKWQTEQFEKNRLKHCNSITNEQAELEQGFIDQHLDKHQRMPTFLDAIEYGMKLKEQQMMAKAVEGDITFDYYGDDDKTYGCIAHDSFCLEDFGLKDRDKIKVIIVKED